MSSYVYISYSQKDSVFADRLHRGLMESGFLTWYDKTEIAAGENWQKRIDEGLSEAKVLLFILSRNSLQSKWTSYEIQYFVSNNRRVVPIIIDDFAASNIPEFLANYQYLDFRKSFKVQFNKLVDALNDLEISATNSKTIKEKKNKGYVFLSYCEEDKKFVTQLKNFMQTNEYAYWDYDESDRDYHNHFFLEIENAITNAAATLSVLSPSWKQSSWSLKEYFFSAEVKTPIFLLIAEPLEPTLVIAGIPYIDFTKDKSSGYSKLGTELRRKKL